jgi:NDP-hexose-3-ketoreductase
MKSRLKIGILGFANIAKKSIIPAIKLLPDLFELVGVGSLKMNHSSEIKFFEGYDKLLNKELIDVVYIPLPNSLHFKWAKIALERGINVLVEKSICTNYFEVEELCRIASENNCVLMENFQFRFHSQLEWIKKIINNNELGNIRSINSNFGFPPFNDVDNIRYNKELGGGALMDAGAYPIKLAQELLGNELEVVHATLNYENKEVDIWGDGKLRQKSGSGFMNFSFGFDNYYQCNLEIWGSLGKLSTNRIFTAPSDYTVKLLIEKNNETEIIEIVPENHFVKSLIHFSNCISDYMLRVDEYKANLNQALLLDNFKKLSYVK